MYAGVELPFVQVFPDLSLPICNKSGDGLVHLLKTGPDENQVFGCGEKKTRNSSAKEVIFSKYMGFEECSHHIVILSVTALSKYNKVRIYYAFIPPRL